MTAIYPEITFQHLQTLGDSVRLCDSEVLEGDLISLYHYRQCDDDSDSLLKQFRGIVFASSATGGEDTTKLIMRGFPYTPEFIVNQENDDSTNSTMVDTITRLFPTSRFFESHEGTIIRVFFHKKWFVSTHKRLDASASRWGSNESFEDIFRRAIDVLGASSDYNYDTFFNRLDKARQYMFLLRNTKENRIVSLAPQGDKPAVYHVGTYINGEFVVDDDIGVVRPPEIKFENADHLFRTVCSMDPLFYQGVFACGDNGFYKLINKIYHDLSKVRGNEPNLTKRYLEVRKSQEDFGAFSFLYKDSATIFENVEKNLNKIARNIHITYMKRFISKQYAVVDPSRYAVLKACHSQYLQNRQPVTLEVVWNVLNSESSDNLYRMLMV
jgi:hypothetical protein